MAKTPDAAMTFRSSVQKVAGPDLYAATVLDSVMPHQVESISYGCDSGAVQDLNATYPNFADNFLSDPEDQHDRALGQRLVRFHQTDRTRMRWPRGAVLRRSNCSAVQNRANRLTPPSPVAHIWYRSFRAKSS